MGIENKLEKLTLFFNKTINLYREKTLKDNPLLKDVSFNKDITINNNDYGYFKHPLSKKDFFKLLTNIQTVENSQFLFNSQILQLISSKIEEINRSYIFPIQKQQKEDFLKQFNEVEINQIKQLLYFLNENKTFVNNNKKSVLKLASNIQFFFLPDKVDDKNIFPEYYNLTYSLLNNDEDFKYMIGLDKSIILGLPPKYIKDFYFSRDKEKQKNYQKDILNNMNSIYSPLIFDFKIEKENIPFVYKTMSRINKSIKYTYKNNSKIEFDFSTFFIKMQAFSQPHFIKKLLSGNNNIDTFFKYRHSESGKKMIPEIGIFNSILLSFLNDSKELNKQEEKDFRQILSILKRHINDDFVKFTNVFKDAFTVSEREKIPYNFKKINQLINIIIDFDPKLIKKISEHKIPSSNYHINYFLLDQELIPRTDTCLWTNCNFELYKTALETNFYGTLSESKTLRMAQYFNINNIYAFSEVPEIEKAALFIAEFTGTTKEKIYEDLLKDFKNDEFSYISHKQANLSYFSWDNEFYKIDFIKKQLKDGKSKNDFLNKSINYYYKLLNNQKDFKITPLQEYLFNEINNNLLEEKSINILLQHDYIINFLSIENKEEDIQRIKEILLTISNPDEIIKNEDFWKNTKWDELPEDFKNKLFVSIEKKSLNSNLQQENIKPTTRRKRM